MITVLLLIKSLDHKFLYAFHHSWTFMDKLDVFLTSSSDVSPSPFCNIYDQSNPKLAEVFKKWQRLGSLIAVTIITL